MRVFSCKQLYVIPDNHAGSSHDHTTLIGHFRVPLCLCIKMSLSTNHSYENAFDLQENEPVGVNSFLYINGFALTLVLIQTQKATRKWPICYNT